MNGSAECVHDDPGPGLAPFELGEAAGVSPAEPAIAEVDCGDADAADDALVGGGAAIDGLAGVGGDEERFAAEHGSPTLSEGGQHAEDRATEELAGFQVKVVLRCEGDGHTDQDHRPEMSWRRRALSRARAIRRRHRWARRDIA